MLPNSVCSWRRSCGAHRGTRCARVHCANGCGPAQLKRIRLVALHSSATMNEPRTMRTYVAGAMVLLALPVGDTKAQDSSRADWRAWAATVDSVSACRQLPMIRRVYGGPGEYTIHRDSVTGRTCKGGPGPGYPMAWIWNGRPVCPDSSPDTWGKVNPPGVAELAPNDILELRATRDSVEMARLHCPIRPRALFFLRTRVDTVTRGAT